jgi:excinuclease ABC subunit A
MIFQRTRRKNYKIQNRVMLSRYRGKTKCHSCKGKRLRVEASYVKINSKTVSELVDLPIKHLVTFFATLELDVYEKQIAKRFLTEINNRLSFLTEVGLDYLTLNRNSASLQEENRNESILQPLWKA